MPERPGTGASNSPFNSFHSGYGGGVHFLLPYGYVVRVEYAWNDYRQGEIVFDLRGSL